MVEGSFRRTLILGVGILAHGGRKLPQNIDWNGLSPEYPKLEQLDIWLSKTNPTHLLLATQKISTVSTLGIRGSMTSYEEETLRKTVQFLQLIRQLNIFSSSVETLWTRAINARVLTIIVKDIFPKTKTVYVFPGDLEASDIIRGGIRHRNEEITPILPWSEEKGSWYLEVLDERRSRIETCFKSLTDA
ncbi:hypothetical protein FRC03_007578 [Tulasnella sp. 419]|nr:hypothetical protein FRC03_007578 [Tulasnella sp. 419]